MHVLDVCISNFLPTSTLHLIYMNYFKRVLGSVVAVAFHITFCAEIHVNDFFLFFKNYF
jgi:hypothetical protein